MARALSNGRGTAGFTLIELMVVMIVIGIMTAMILPEMKGTYQDALLRSTSRELVNVFSLASSRAISADQLHRVQLDPKSGRYVVERRVMAGGREIFVPLKDVTGGEGQLDQRISIEVRKPAEDFSNAPDAAANSGGDLPGRGEAVAFYPDGTADAGEVLLRDREGFRLALRINPVTARVHIVELGRE